MQRLVITVEMNLGSKFLSQAVLGVDIVPSKLCLIKNFFLFVSIRGKDNLRQRVNGTF